jgi:hypothetical protein
LFNKAVLDWADIVCPVDIDLHYEAKESDAALEELKRQSFCNDGVPFVAVSPTPLSEKYFENHYFICYFVSPPHKLRDGTYLATGVIGE